MDLEYVKCGDYIIPALELPEKEYRIGKYGLMRKRYLQEHRKGVYSAMLLDGTLYTHLQEVDILAHDCLSQVVKKHAERQCTTERLKAENQLEWVGRMNNIRNRAEEIALSEYIYV